MHILPQPDTIFLSWPIPNSTRKCRDSLRYEIMQQIVKDAAVYFGFSPKKFGCQSLRSGGATLLRAVRASDSEIMMMGRWKSMPACLGYQEQSTNTHDRLLKVLLTEGAYSNRSVYSIQNQFVLSQVHIWNLVINRAIKMP
jgi:hypothetical protein